MAVAGLENRLRADHGVAARPIFDHNGLFPKFGERVRYCAGRRIRRSHARSEGSAEPNWSLWRDLGPSLHSNETQSGEKDARHEPKSKISLHCSLPGRTI